MKKIFAGLVFLAITATALQAQDPQQKMLRMHEGRNKMMYQQLNLSEEQKQKFKSLNDDFRKKMSDLNKQDEITVKEWKTKMAEMQQKHRNEMQSVLTQEQKNRIEKMKTERMQMAEIDAKARMEKMKLQLGLTNEQTEKLNAQRKEMLTKMKALHDDLSMDMGKKREEMREMMEKRKETMRSILTEEQRKKMQEIRKHQPRDMRMRQPRSQEKLS